MRFQELEQLANSNKLVIMSRFVTSGPGEQGYPIQTAKLVASVDQVSNGRFLFGAGGGWNQDEMEDHGHRVRKPLQGDAQADRGDEGEPANGARCRA